MVSALPTIFPMDSGQDALFEAAFTLKPSMTSPTRLDLRADLEKDIARFSYRPSQNPLITKCVLPTCGQVELPGRPPNEVAHWLAIVDYWWRLHEGQKINVRSMQRRFKASNESVEFFRESISESIRVRIERGLECVIRRRIYFEAEDVSLPQNFLATSHSVQRAPSIDSVVPRTVNAWSGDGLIRSSHNEGQYRLSIYYGLTAPGRSDGQVVLHGLVCRSRMPFWADNMGEMRIRTDSVTGQTRVQHVPHPESPALFLKH